MKETILQFGTGVFLRAFLGDMVNTLHKRGLYDGSVIIVQPTPNGKVPQLRAQNMKYGLLVRGLADGRTYERYDEIGCISRAVDPYTEYGDYLALARIPELKFIVSNTTEKGIAYDPSDIDRAHTPITFPGKLTALLYERYKAKLPGFVIIPCELIDDNARRLRECVLSYCRLWGLGSGFEEWLAAENEFCPNLVDRIVSGYPEAEAEEIFRHTGRRDALLDTSEPYLLWAVQADHEAELPLRAAGFDVIWTDDITPYKKRKLRLLNGAHTAMVPSALLCGLKLVREAMRDSDISAFYDRFMKEILFAFGGGDDANAFAAAVRDRFANPFIDHQLNAIAANSIEKFRIRVLPSIIDYKNAAGEYPRALCFSLAALLRLYKKGMQNDAPDISAYIRDTDIPALFSDEKLWGCDLTGMCCTIEEYYAAIENHGIREALRRI